MPAFSHPLILKNGRMLAAGKSDGLNSKNPSRAFGTRMRLRRVKNRYALAVMAKNHMR